MHVKVLLPERLALSAGATRLARSRDAGTAQGTRCVDPRVTCQRREICILGTRRHRPRARSLGMALLLCATLASGLIVGAPGRTMHSRACDVSMSLHALSATGMDGAEVDLKSLAGKRVIAVNVACVPLSLPLRTNLSRRVADACSCSHHAAPNEAGRGASTRRSPISTRR